MVQPTQCRNGDHLVRRRNRTHRRPRDLLSKPLMGPGLIEVQHIGLEKSRELLLMKNQEVIQTFSPHASQKALTDGIGSWRSVRRAKHLDPTCGRYVCKIRAEFPVVITNQIFGVCPYGVASRSCCATHRSFGRHYHFLMPDAFELQNTL